MANEYLVHFLEGQDNKHRGQSQNWTTQYGWHTQCKKTPLAWICDKLRMDHQCMPIPRQALHWAFPGFKRGLGHPRTNRRSRVKKDLLKMGIGRKQMWQLKTDQNGVRVWPNVPTWMRVESRLRSGMFRARPEWKNNAQIFSVRAHMLLPWWPIGSGNSTGH